MEQEKFKCPQCGATNVEKIGVNQYSCPYCGHHFYVQNDAIVEGNRISKYNELSTRRRQRNQELMDKEEKFNQLFVIALLISFVLLVCFLGF